MKKRVTEHTYLILLKLSKLNFLLVITVDFGNQCEINKLTGDKINEKKKNGKIKR